MSTTLRKSLRILEALATSETPRGISELSREIKMNKSAVQRIFQTLAEDGYIKKAPGTSRYKSTLRLWELGASVIAQNETRRLIRPILRYAAKVSSLTCYFAWADFPDIIYLDKVEGEKGRPNSSDPGQRSPMYAAASGRAILAFLDDEKIKQVLHLLETKAEIRDSGEYNNLLEEFALIRERHYATSERGSVSRISSVAAPVWGADAVPVGSIVLTSDANTLPRADFDRTGAMAVSIAEQASRVLGGGFPAFASEAP